MSNTADRPILLLGRLLAWAAALPPQLRGAGWIVLSALCFALIGVIVRFLSGTLHTVEIVFLRGLAGILIVLPLVFRAGFGSIRTRRLPMHGLRAFSSSASTFGVFYAFAHLPLATAVTFTFTKPLFLTVLAVLLLAELVSARRWTATACGFAGVLIMTRPGVEGFDPTVLVALGAAFFQAGTMVVIKRLSTTEEPLTILFYATALSAVMTGLPSIAVWRPPGAMDLALIVALAATATLTQYCNIRALRVAEASAVVPFDYFRLLFAGVFGYLLFAEVPDALTLLGAGVIVASALAIARERRRPGA